MEGEETFGAKYDENCLRSDSRLRIQGMSGFFSNEFVDIAWDNIFLDDDRMVPHQGSKRLNDHSTLGENKRSCYELAINNDGSTTKYVDHGKEKSGILPLSKSKNTMFEKDSWPLKQNGLFSSGPDNELIEEASSLACDSTMFLPHGLKSNNKYLNSSEVLMHDTILTNNVSLVDDKTFNFSIGDAKHTDNDLGFFESDQNKDSNDLLYYGWSEIENFHDTDMMFRSDSTLDLDVSKEEDLSWLSSADDIGRSGGALKSNAKFPYPNPSETKTISENHDFSNGYSPNTFPMVNAPIKYKDCSWTSEKSDSYKSSLTGPDIEGMGFNAKIQPKISTSSHFRPGNASVTSEHKKQSRSDTRKVHCLERGILDQINDLQNEVMKPHSSLTLDEAFASVHVQQQHAPATNSNSCFENPIPDVHLKESLSDPSSVNLEQSIVKIETNDLASISPRDSDHSSSNLQHMDGFSGPPFKDTSIVLCCQREILHSNQANLSARDDSLKNGSFVVHASDSDPGFVEKRENLSDHQVLSSATAAEMCLSNMQGSSTMVPDVDDISLEAASFRQLQRITKQLDLRTKLCMRDSLYRLAQSAEQRRSAQNLNDGFEDEGDAAGGASEAEASKRCAGFMDMETDTNPVDRSVAHLLFHRASDSSSSHVGDSFHLKSPNACSKRRKCFRGLEEGTRKLVTKCSSRGCKLSCSNVDRFRFSLVILACTMYRKFLRSYYHSKITTYFCCNVLFLLPLRLQCAII